MGLQKTASNTDLLLQCPRPFHATTEIAREPPGEAAEYGTLVHRGVELCLQGRLTGGKGEITQWACWAEAQDDSTYEHVRRVICAFDDWRHDSPWGPLRVLSAEGADKHNLDENDNSWNATSPAILDRETHTYDLPEGGNYIAGTSDIILETENGRAVVVDLKTGLSGDISSPELLGQMKTLAMMHDTGLIAIIHAPKGFPVSIHTGELDDATISAHRHALWHASVLTNAPSPFMRAGPKCTHCPARSDCPARAGEIERSALTVARRSLSVAGVSAPLTTLEESAPGALHELIQAFDSLAKGAKERLRERVAAGEHIVRPDGKVLTLSSSEVESLSKASITAALGKEEAEKVISELRARGALKTYTRTELRAKEVK